MNMEVKKNMTEKKQIYKCEQCGNIVEVLHAGVGELVCCGEPMELMEEKTEDSSQEKHVPFIEKKDNGFLVRIGQNAAHPMEDKHYIEWIELIVDGVSHRRFLNPGNAPEAFFEVSGDQVFAREYCNVHGLWKS